MVPLPAAEARRDRLSGKVAHLYYTNDAHDSRASRASRESAITCSAFQPARYCQLLHYLSIKVPRESATVNAQALFFSRIQCKRAEMGQMTHLINGYMTYTLERIAAYQYA
jgi:hypothetical protein